MNVDATFAVKKIIGKIPSNKHSKDEVIFIKVQEA